MLDFFVDNWDNVITIMNAIGLVLVGAKKKRN
jgi:hypothetical protein